MYNLAEALGLTYWEFQRLLFDYITYGKAMPVLPDVGVTQISGKPYTWDSVAADYLRPESHSAFASIDLAKALRDAKFQQ